MYQYETRLNGRWVAVIRYDCAHDSFHRDVLWPNGDKDKQFLEMVSLESAAKYAKKDIENRWEWYKERYINNLKKK
jgi:hypothetical protein